MFIDFRERRRERETSIGRLLYAPRLGTKTATQVCVLTRNQTPSLLVHSNQLSHPARALWRYFVGVIVIYNQLTYVKEIILDNLGGSDPISWKASRRKLGFFWGKSFCLSTVASACPSWWFAPWISDLPSHPQSLYKLILCIKSLNTGSGTNNAPF